MFPDTWPPAAAIAAGPGAQLTGTEEERVDQGLVLVLGFGLGLFHSYFIGS